MVLVFGSELGDMTPDDMDGRLLHYLSERAKMRQFDDAILAALGTKGAAHD